MLGTDTGVWGRRDGTLGVVAVGVVVELGTRGLNVGASVEVFKRVSFVGEPALGVTERRDR